MYTMLLCKPLGKNIKFIFINNSFEEESCRLQQESSSNLIIKLPVECC